MFTAENTRGYTADELVTLNSMLPDMTGMSSHETKQVEAHTLITFDQQSDPEYWRAEADYA